MTKLILGVAFLIVAASGLFARSSATINLDETMKYESRIASFYPRYEASSGSFRTLDFIRQTLSTNNISFQTLDFTTLEDAHSFSQVVVATVPGTLPDTLIIAVPINHGFDTPRSRDGSAAIALALSLAVRYRADPVAVTIKFVFLGAERPPEPTQNSEVAVPDSGAAKYPLGSRLFLQSYYPDAPVAVLYLNIASAGSPMVIQPAGSNTIAPQWLLERAVQSANSAGLDVTIPAKKLFAYRVGRAAGSTAVGPYLAAGLPAVAIEDRANAVSGDGGATAASLQSATATSTQSATALWYGQLSLFVDRFLTMSHGGFPQSWDHHYLVLRFGTHYQYIGERTIILILLCSLAALLLFAVFRRTAIGRYARTIVRNVWNLPVLLGIIFVFLWISTLGVDAFLRIRRFPDLWQHAPVAFFGLKLALSIFLSMLAFRLLHRIRISKNGSFYTASALFFLLLDIGISALINITFVLYFLAAFFCAFLFSITRIRLLKAVFLVAAPILIIKAGWDILAAPELEIVHTMLISPVKGNLLIAFITLPFLLMIIRMDFLIRHPVRGRRSFGALVASGAAGVVTLALAGYLFFYHAYNAENPQPVSAMEQVAQSTGTHTLLLESPASIGGMHFSFGGKPYVVPSGAGRSYSIAFPETPDPVSASAETRSFLGRMQTVLTVAPRPDVRFLDLGITLNNAPPDPSGASATGTPNRNAQSSGRGAASNPGNGPPAPLVIYDLSLPYTYNLENHSVAVFVGVNPPRPLNVEYTVPADARPAVTIHALFRDLSQPFSILSRGYAATTIMIATSRLTPAGTESAGR